ncbi:MAG: hypothetical protein WBD20_01175 [Pirellulaceae bacterium]
MFVARTQLATPTQALAYVGGIESQCAVVASVREERLPTDFANLRATQCVWEDGLVVRTLCTGTMDLDT